MKSDEVEKVCFQYACPRYPQCGRARGKGCCIDYPEREEELVHDECGPKMVLYCLWRWGADGAPLPE